MRMTRKEIAALIPHGEGICMLDEVVGWNDAGIRCRTQAVSEGNPLAEGGRLHAPVLVEYAAQAAAVHAGLLGGDEGAGPDKPALVGAVRNLDLLEKPEMGTDLEIEAWCTARSGDGAIYEFEVHQRHPLIRGKLVLSGRLAGG